MFPRHQGNADTASAGFQQADVSCAVCEAGRVVRPKHRELRWSVRWVNGSDERKVGEDTEEDEQDADPTEQYEFGERRTRRMRDPREPTREEREEHEKARLPFRSWCKHCVRGRGKQLPHYRGGHSKPQ